MTQKYIYGLVPSLGLENSRVLDNLQTTFLRPANNSGDQQSH